MVRVERDSHVRIDRRRPAAPATPKRNSRLSIQTGLLGPGSRCVRGSTGNRRFLDARLLPLPSAYWRSIVSGVCRTRGSGVMQRPIRSRLHRMFGRARRPGARAAPRASTRRDRRRRRRTTREHQCTGEAPSDVRGRVVRLCVQHVFECVPSAMDRVAGEGVEIASPLDERPKWCQRVVSGGVGRRTHAALDRRREPVALSSARIVASHMLVGHANARETLHVMHADAGGRE